MNALAKYLKIVKGERKFDTWYGDFYDLPLKKQIKTFFDDREMINVMLIWDDLSSISGGLIDREDISDACRRGLKKVSDKNTFKIQCLQILRGTKSLKHYFKGVEGFDGTIS